MTQTDQGPNSTTAQTGTMLPDQCPVIPMRDLVLFRNQYSPIRVGRPVSLNALLRALEDDKRLALFTQTDEAVDVPTIEDLLPVGVFAEIMKHIVLPEGAYLIIVHGIERVTVGEVIATDPYFRIKPNLFTPDESPQEGVTAPSLTDLREAIGALIRFQPSLAVPFQGPYDTLLSEGQFWRKSLVPPELGEPASRNILLFEQQVLEPTATSALRALYLTTAAGVHIDPSWDNERLADAVMMSVETARKNKIESLLERSSVKRLAHAYGMLVAERRHAEWNAELKERVTVAIKDQHRELFLREQLRIILEELGESVAITLHNPVFRGRGFAADATLAFVLMPFATRFRPVFDELVKPVAERFQLRCVRADDLYGPRPIMEDIWRLVNEARIIIADVTDKNPNVFYEVGLAHAVGKEVVIISQSLDDVPFDLRHLRCIVYQDSVAGFKQFERRLDETLAAIPGLKRAGPAS